MASRRPPTTKISAIVSDVDGTLVTNDKQLTDRSRAAVAAIRKAGIPFSIISSRPPRGIASLMKALGIDRPSAGFNGGVVVAPDLSVLQQHLISPESCPSHRRFPGRARGRHLGVQRPGLAAAERSRAACRAREHSPWAFRPSLSPSSATPSTPRPRSSASAKNHDFLKELRDRAGQAHGERRNRRSLPALLSRHDRSARQQGRGIAGAGQTGGCAAVGSRRDRRWRQRRHDVRTGRSQHRHGQCPAGGQGGGPLRHRQQQRGRLRQAVERFILGGER